MKQLCLILAAMCIGDAPPPVVTETPHAELTASPRESSVSPGFEMDERNLTEESKKLVGDRVYHVDTRQVLREPPTVKRTLYIAISVNEAKEIKPRLYAPNQVGSTSPWFYAFEDKIIVSVWQKGRDEPFYALRRDYFASLVSEIVKVHADGKLPPSIVKGKKL